MRIVTQRYTSCLVVCPLGWAAELYAIYLAHLAIIGAQSAEEYTIAPVVQLRFGLGELHVPAAVRPYLTLANLLYVYLPIGYLYASPKLYLFMWRRRRQVLAKKTRAKSE